MEKYGIDQDGDTISAYGAPDDSPSHKPGCIELFYTQYVHKLVDVIGYNFPPGPEPRTRVLCDQRI